MLYSLSYARPTAYTVWNLPLCMQCIPSTWMFWIKKAMQWVSSPPLQSEFFFESLTNQNLRNLHWHDLQHRHPWGTTKSKKAKSMLVFSSRAFFTDVHWAGWPGKFPVHPERSVDFFIYFLVKLPLAQTAKIQFKMEKLQKNNSETKKLTKVSPFLVALYFCAPTPKDSSPISA